jgi:hypothetical protein
VQCTRFVCAAFSNCARSALFCPRSARALIVLRQTINWITRVSDKTFHRRALLSNQLAVLAPLALLPEAKRPTLAIGDSK